MSDVVASCVTEAGTVAVRAGNEYAPTCSRFGVVLEIEVGINAGLKVTMSIAIAIVVKTAIIESRIRTRSDLDPRRRVRI